MTYSSRNAKISLGFGRSNSLETLFAGFGEALLDDLVAQFDALVADVDAGTGDQLLHLLLAFAAEGTLEQVGALPDAGHSRSPLA